MIDIILFIILTSFVCLGIYNARDLILSTPSAWLELNLPRWITDPLIGCVYCMASVYSVLSYIIAYYTGLINFSPVLLVLIVPAVSYLNGIIFTLVFNND